jgi:uncharacterized protein YodC (DUF2158 family)
MDETEFSVGDTVALNSGGPLMTVEGTLESTGEVCCVYFNSGEEFCRVKLPKDTLTWTVKEEEETEDDSEESEPEDPQ